MKFPGVRGRDAREGATPAAVAPPPAGLEPAMVAVIVVAALALGGWLATQVPGSRPAEDAGLPAPAAPDTAQQGEVRSAIAALNTEREAGRLHLASATRPDEQAAAARDLRRAHLRAADRVAGSAKDLAAALRRTAAGRVGAERDRGPACRRRAGRR